MGKNVIRRLKLELEAGKANPAKVGKDLAPTGINLLAFCQKYNELTAGQQGMIIPAEVTVFEDRSFVLRTKTPPPPSFSNVPRESKRGPPGRATKPSPPFRERIWKRSPRSNCRI